MDGLCPTCLRPTKGTILDGVRVVECPDCVERFRLSDLYRYLLENLRLDKKSR